MKERFAQFPLIVASAIILSSCATHNSRPGAATEPRRITPEVVTIYQPGAEDSKNDLLDDIDFVLPSLTIDSLLSFAQNLAYTGIGTISTPDVKEQSGSLATGLTVQLAFRVVKVRIGSPADLAGFQPGDWIIAIQGKTLCSKPYEFKPDTSSTEATELQFKYWLHIMRLLHNECKPTPSSAIESAEKNIKVEVERNNNKAFMLVTQKTRIGSEAEQLVRNNYESFVARLSEVRGQLVALRTEVARTTPSEKAIRALTDKYYASVLKGSQIYGEVEKYYNSDSFWRK